jgi:flagella basal body P-ring formation protein FlgA
MRSTVLIVLLLAAVRSSAADAPTLRAAAAVRAGGIFLADLVEGLADIPRVRLGPSPAAAGTTNIARGVVLAALSASGVEVTNLAGPAVCRVSRRTRPLGETEVRDLLAAELQRRFAREGGELELRLPRAWRDVEILDEPFELRLVDVPARGLSQLFSLRFELLAGDESLGQWQAGLAAKLWREVAVAAVAIRRGSALADAEVVLERRDVLALRDPLYALPEAAADHEFAEPVAVGQPLSTRSLRPRTVILRGRAVDAVVRSGPMEISTRVEALEDGAIGQLIRVRNPRSRREFRARVVAEDNVAVPL